MNLYLRLLIAFAFGIRRRLHYGAASECTFRVWPHDLDLFGHMNNGRYLQIMDVARFQWMASTGVLATLRRHRFTAVLGGTLTRYRHSLKPFQRYRVRTRLVHWDDRWFFFEHTFIDSSGRSVAAGLSRAAIRANGSWVDTRVVAESVSSGAVSPPAPAYVADWLALDRRAFQGDEPALEVQGEEVTI